MPSSAQRPTSHGNSNAPPGMPALPPPATPAPCRRVPRGDRAARIPRQDRSLHLKGAGGAAAVLAVVMWGSIETATTVGYGDFYPVTHGGRVIGALVMVVGITTYGVVTAALATWFVGREQKRRHHLALDAHESGEEAVPALHDRFDRLERMVARTGERK